MRRLFALVATVLLVDTMFLAALAPLLPSYVAELGISKGAAGVLSAAYPAGTLLASLPSGWVAARIGVRPTMLIGLALLGVSSLAFAFGDTILVLDLARVAQGIGGAFAWTAGLAWLIGAAPSDRRGELIGAAMAAAVTGLRARAGPGLDRHRDRPRGRVHRRRRARRGPDHLDAGDAAIDAGAGPVAARGRRRDPHAADPARLLARCGAVGARRRGRGPGAAATRRARRDRDRDRRDLPRLRGGRGRDQPRHRQALGPAGAPAGGPGGAADGDRCGAAPAAAGHGGAARDRRRGRVLGPDPHLDALDGAALRAHRGRRRRPRVRHRAAQPRLGRGAGARRIGDERARRRDLRRRRLRIDRAPARLHGRGRSAASPGR